VGFFHFLLCLFGVFVGLSLVFGGFCLFFDNCDFVSFSRSSSSFCGMNSSFFGVSVSLFVILSGFLNEFLNNFFVFN